MMPAGSALEPHPYSYPYDLEGSSAACATCGGPVGSGLHDPSLAPRVELKRPRLAHLMPSRYDLEGVLKVALLAAVLAGAILGDLWLAAH